MLWRFPKELFDHVAAIGSLLLIWRSTNDHNFQGLTSIHFLSCRGTETGVSVIVDFIRGLASAIGFPKTLCSSSSMVSVVSVTYFSTPFTIRTQEAVLSWNRDRTWISFLSRSSWWQTYVSKTRPISVFLRVQCVARVLGSFRSSAYFRHKCAIPSRSFCIKCDKILPSFDSIQTSVRAQFG